MARTIQPDCRQCRREGCKLFLKGERCTTKKCAMERRPVIPGQHGNSRRRVAFSEYGTQLREKQKVKRMYGILENQMREYYEAAERMKGVTGENMKVGDVIAIKESKQDVEAFKALRETKIVTPKWLEFDPATLSGKILALPKREDIDSDIKEQLIIEMYSR